MLTSVEKTAELAEEAVEWAWGVGGSRIREVLGLHVAGSVRRMGGAGLVVVVHGALLGVMDLDEVHESWDWAGVSRGSGLLVDDLLAVLELGLLDGAQESVLLDKGLPLVGVWVLGDGGGHIGGVVGVDPVGALGGVSGAALVAVIHRALLSMVNASKVLEAHWINITLLVIVLNGGVLEMLERLMLEVLKSKIQVLEVQWKTFYRRINIVIDQLLSVSCVFVSCSISNHFHISRVHVGPRISSKVLELVDFHI